MEELTKLHELVKEHPYRVNEEEKYLKSYKELLYKLSDSFHKALAGNKYLSARGMIHDFNRDIGNIGRNWKRSDESNLHVERCISTIHDYILTGEILSFWGGVGYLFRSVGNYVRYSWDEEKSKYCLDIPKEKIPQLVNDISEYIKTLPDNREHWKDIIDYWKNEIENLNLKLNNK